ncbi:hypothetical protein GCM10011289_15620 [Paludibacterium paludis]|uniref:Trypsin-like peptidase n=2 Tax=Paludibacterium paludis TaxID=1225769 RepID=A0A918U8X6_9NEIS|nr:hypothetical protein GCM10011289_15620 [Paludibacterium paludis]
MLGLVDRLRHTTVRLECRKTSGECVTGTAFFFTYRWEDGQVAPMVVTCSHVIRDACQGAFVLTRADEQGDPLTGWCERVVFDRFASFWRPHACFDISIMPFAPILQYAAGHGLRFYTPAFEENNLPTPPILAALTGLESVLMPGYPDGIWDEMNNLPVLRRGFAATSPNRNYAGRPDFLIDCACFPGASGSPVVMVGEPAGAGPEGVTLLGVLYAGMLHPLDESCPARAIPNNLGLVLKSESLQTFKALIRP